MVSFSVNPFSSRNTFEMTGSVGGLSLSSTNGSTIPLKDLTEYIEVKKYSIHSFHTLLFFKDGSDKHHMDILTSVSTILHQSYLVDGL